MAFPSYGGGGPSSFPMPFQQNPSQTSSQPSPFTAQPRGPTAGMHPPNPLLDLQDQQFDIFEWYPQYQSCLRYFLDHAQYSGPVQALAAFVNIQLPHQKPQHPILSSRSAGSPSGMPSPSARASGNLPMPTPSNGIIVLNSYIRRLVAMGFDSPAVLHGFFGDDWVAGISPIHEIERRNYLFAAKSASWLDVKSHYDMVDGQNIPFLRPLQNVTEKEIVSAESNWSEWLAMQDWMVGSRSIDGEVGKRPPIGLKNEVAEQFRSRYDDIG
ncbi:hypothetical protein BJ170DRAFT_119444 [Xylariales sp. AK1849]|nr:hypothetical protein BJ170DRAFT_119444 [Xylariales sp. AK1849]